MADIVSGTPSEKLAPDLHQTTPAHAHAGPATSRPSLAEAVLARTLTVGKKDRTPSMDRVCMGTESSAENNCVICLDPFEADQKLRRLPCEHRFHRICIDEWLVSKLSVCPLCKFDCAVYCIDHADPAKQKRLRERQSRRLTRQPSLPPPDLVLGLH
ncbi:hypothetical protein IWQ60_000738 [Tieghemiomyces parasiticus]|uniref:RING-type domain-containing protein n=1 Tax=Tieghemiomyces parasiticus TaxID=78921 RepID=A0A9W8AFB1_9FUNG|nr:hypothetical protein IWQ60_000738 [Tieghemiomyces parasiticus]